MTLILLLGFINLKAQMEVFPADGVLYTTDYLMTDVFLGEGVEVTNITYNGVNSSTGIFTNATADLGIERGVVMSTGLATDAPGVGCNPGTCGTTGNTGIASSTNASGGDADLNTASGVNTEDVSVFTMTFVPTSDVLEFRYVFGSEEYDGYTCSSFNDAFGFFISGPGINGPYQNNAENIALIPGTNLPVSINTVNGGTPNGAAANCDLTNTQYFVDNNPSIASVEYSGFTTVLTATAVVIPCETYQIKLAIGDGGDDILDSAIFLEFGSFGTGSVQVEAATVSIDGTVSESCSDATISFTLPSPAETDIPLNYVIEGTAENGVDYTFIPDNLFIPQGSDSIGFNVEGFEDGIVEGTESIYMIVETDICFYDTVRLFITDYQLSEPMMNDTTICNGTNAMLDATIPTFVPPPVTFTNTDTEVLTPEDPHYFPIAVGGIPFEEIQPGVINSVCFNISNTLLYEILVYLITPGGQILELSTQNGQSSDFAEAYGSYTNTCFTEGAITPINYNPSGENYAPASSKPFTGNWLPESPWSDIYGGPVNGTWQLVVYDPVAGFAPTYEDWSITFNSDYFITYQWSDPSTLTCNDCATPEAFPNTSTTYTVTISDTYGCTITGEVDVDVISQLDTPVLTCGTSTSTSVIMEWAEVPGAVGYEINVDGAGWTSVNPGDLFYEVTGLTVGQTISFELVAISDDCSDSPIATIDCTAQPCSLVTNLDGTTNENCAGASDGTATLSATGTGTITFDIGGGNSNTTGIFTDLSAGDYTVSITDDDCTLTETFTIIESAELLASLTFTDISCNGNNDGAIIVSVTGGTPDYTYQWSGGLADTDETVDALSAGDYTVTVTDNNGCTVSLSQTISENSAITLSSSTTDATCNGIADGTATVSAMGGTDTFDYLWDAAAGDQTTATATGLDVGDYTVIVTDSDGCTATETVTISAPSSMTTTMSSTQASCSGSTDGTATVVASGGAGGYSYEWEDGQTTDQATGFSDGWHYVTVTDMNGCMVNDSVEITVPNPINLDISGTNVSCNGASNGIAMVTASGGAGGFTYAWNVTGETNSDIANLIAATYTVIVTDANNCSSSASIEITEPEAISGTMSITDVTCNEAANGAITVAVSGGAANYTYAWSGGITDTDDTVEGLSGGDYTVTVTDDNNCTFTTTGAVMENPAITLTTSFTDALCNDSADGTATVVAMNGIGDYTYQWDSNAADQTTDTATGLDAGTYEVTVTDENACTASTSVSIAVPAAITTSMSSTEASCSGSTDGTATVVSDGGTGTHTYEWEDGQVAAAATGFSDGWHYVTVTDANGCIATDSVEVTVPNPINLTISGTNVSCNGGDDGSTMVEATGGAGGFTYQWSGAGGTDDNIAQATAATYTVTVTDANGCTNTASIEVTEPEALGLSLATTNVDCFGESTGSIMASVTGGTGQIDYSWSNGETTSTINNLAADTYTVIITDMNACTISATATITENTELTSSMSVGGASCSGGGDGSATVTPNGGVAPYMYEWSNGETTATVTGLMAQTYTVIVTDDVGCTTTNSIDVAEPPALSVSVSGTDITCFNGDDGTATAVGDGGDGNYTFTWTSGTGNSQSNLIAGTYTVTITDGSGCTAENSLTLNEPTEVIVSHAITDVDCNGTATGAINLTTSGGTTPYQYIWADGSTLEDYTDAAAGDYTVTITDANGCSKTETFTIIEPSAISISLASTDVFCFMGSDGAVDATISGGTTPYSYAWSNGAGTEDLNNIPADDYTITITDANGCSATATTTVTQPASGVSVMMSADEAVCFGATTASAMASPSGGAVGYTYLWSNDETTATISNLGVGTYTVTVTDGNGCTTSGEMQVNELAEIAVVANAISTSCNNGSDGSATVTNISGGVGTIITDYTVVWGTIPAQNGLQATGLNANQSYTVTVTDNMGCTGTTSVVIPNPTAVTVELTASTPVTCAGETDGTLSVSGFGGTAPYTYAWSTGEAIATAIDLGLGFYTVTVSDLNGCTVTGTFEMTNPSLLTVTIQETDATCKTDANGSAIANPEGGVPPYSYEWSTGETTQEITSLASANYNVTVTDGNGCVIVASVYISEPDWLSFTTTTENVTCNGDRDGSIIIEAAGGTAPYSYSFDSGASYSSTAAMTGLYPGDYGIAVQDANGCVTLVDIIPVFEPSPVIATILPDTTVITYELGDSIQLGVDVANFVESVSYDWNMLYGNENLDCTDCAEPWFFGYENNRLEVVVTDANGCVGTDEIEIQVVKNREVYVPSGFTPNNDGINDVLMVHGKTGTRVTDFRVYDRWGELVFKADMSYNINSENSLRTWNGEYKGKPMNPGVYIWTLQVRYIDGRKERFEGNTMLLR